MKKLWILYFSILLIGGFIPLITYLGKTRVIEFESLLSFINFLLYITPVYSYVFGIKILPSGFWKWFFYIAIFMNIFSFVSEYTFLNSYISLNSISNDNRWTLLELFIFMLFVSPIFVSIFRLSKNKFLK
jgi:hypothetical protein